MPGPSPYGFLSYWFKNVGVDDCLEILCITEPNDQVSVRIAHDRVGGQTVLHITLADETYLNWIDALGNVDLPSDSDWHNVIVSWDTSGGIINYTLDRIAGSFSELAVVGGGFSIPYTDDGYALFGSSISGAVIGAFAEVFFLIPEAPITINSAVLDKFVDDDLHAEDIGATGAGAFGQDSRPNIYLSGDAEMFAENIAFDDFTLVSRTAALPARSFTLGPDATIEDADDSPFLGPSTPPSTVASARLASLSASPRSSLEPALPRS